MSPARIFALLRSIASRSILSLALLLHAGLVAAAPGVNCNLDAPPAEAGVDRYLGVLLKVYPRTPDIGPDYAGCQTLWAQTSDGWEVLGVAHFAGGRVVRVENPATPHDPVEQCLVRDGAVVRGDPELCAQLDDMRFESLPAGCLDPGKAGPQCIRR